jgi:hypothetical protein
LRPNITQFPCGILDSEDFVSVNVKRLKHQLLPEEIAAEVV